MKSEVIATIELFIFHRIQSYRKAKINAMLMKSNIGAYNKILTTSYQYATSQ